MNDRLWRIVFSGKEIINDQFSYDLLARIYLPQILLIARLVGYFVSFNEVSGG